MQQPSRLAHSGRLSIVLLFHDGFKLLKAVRLLLGNYPSAITELSKGRLLAGDDRTASAASQEAAIRKAFVAQGPRGFW